MLRLTYWKIEEHQAAAVFVIVFPRKIVMDARTIRFGGTRVRCQLHTGFDGIVHVAIEMLAKRT